MSGISPVYLGQMQECISSHFCIYYIGYIVYIHVFVTFLREISLLTVLVYIKNEPSLCMNNCLCESQLYDREYLFCKSMPNKIFVCSSLSNMTNVWENLKLAIQRCKVALPSEDSDDPSDVLSYTAAGSILVL